MMRFRKRISWMMASVLAVALAGCCNGDRVLGVKESGGATGGGPAVGAVATALATASGYGVLAGTAVTNTGSTTITGDLGVSPGNTLTGSPTVSGATNLGNAAAATAQNDLTAAYNAAAGLTTGAITIAGDLGGRTLAPGLYKSTSTLGITGTLTLNGLGHSDATFVIQMGSALTTATGSKIVLIGGAQAKNIIWQVTSSATLGTNSVFKGTILALSSITLGTGATVDGRMLARNGTVTLDSNAIVAQ
jgi:hypothetical protein